MHYVTNLPLNSFLPDLSVSLKFSFTENKKIKNKKTKNKKPERVSSGFIQEPKQQFVTTAFFFLLEKN